MRRIPAPGRLVDAGGVRLHLHIAGRGDGPLVVFDAGLGECSLAWACVAPLVAEGARVCVYDRAGFAWSDDAPLPRTAGRAADELHRALAAAGEPGPYLLVGHSYGAMVARIVAGRHPEHVAGLVLVDPATPEAWIAPSVENRALALRAAWLARRAVVASRLGLTGLMSRLILAGAFGPARRLVQLFTGGRLGEDAEWMEAILLKLPAGTRAILPRVWSQAKFYRALASQIEHVSVSAAEVVAASSRGHGALPLVTISASHPTAERLREQDALARLSSNGQHLVAARSSHWIALDEPEWLASVILAVYQRVGVRYVRKSQSPTGSKTL